MNLSGILTPEGQPISWPVAILSALPGKELDQLYSYNGAVISGVGCRARLTSLWNYINLQVENLSDETVASSTGPIIFGPLPSWARPSVPINGTCRVRAKTNSTTSDMSVGFFDISKEGMVQFYPAYSGAFVVGGPAGLIGTICIRYRIDA